MKTNPTLRLKCAAVALSLLAVSGFPALAATLTVTNPADSGPGSLRDAISSAAPGDKINFAPALNGQTITLTSGELLISQNLTIQGPGANQLTVNGNHASRIFHTVTDATLAGLTITNGSAADFGGGVFHENGTLTVTKCVILGNTATGVNSRGGGVYAGASLVLKDSTVSQNSAANGSGIYGENSYYGGINNPVSVTISRSTIDHNIATLSGGGIYLITTMYMGDSTLAYNSAPAGGGIYINLSGQDGVVLDACTITGNSANPNSGGGIFFSNNSYASMVSLSNSIVAFQQGGGNIVANASVFVDGSITTDDPNLNLDPNGLQLNGGPTKTIALLAGSSAIDTAIPPSGSYVGVDLSRVKDQRGGDRPAGNGSDIGAYEYNPSSCATVVTNTNDSGPGSLRCAIASSFTGDTITFAPNVGPQINLTSGELLIQKDLTIQGPGAKVLTVSGSSLSRVFRVNSAQVAMSGITIANGMTPSIVGPVVSTSGAGILVSGFSGASTRLTLSACTVTGNQVTSGLVLGAGIAITNTSATISNCTISNNHALQGVTPDSTGGGIGGNVPGDVTIVNTTISGNSSNNGGGIGIRFPSTGTAHTTITNSTISGNAATISGGGLHFYNSSMVLGSTLIALNSAPSGPDIMTDANPNIGGNPMVSSVGYNLVGTAVGYVWINGAGDQLGVANPGLELDVNNQPLLKDNGGSTQTIALVPGSPAIDLGFADASLTTDQRGSGFARVVGGAVDVGAFEVQPLPVVTISGPPVNPTATSNPTPRFYFTVSDPLATTFCSVAGDPAIQCSSPFTTRSLVDGSYTLSVYAKDVAGNIGPTATFAFTIDHLAPVISIPVPPNITTTNNARPSFTFADVGPSGTAVMFQCRVDSGANAPCSSPFTVAAPLADGSHTLTVTGIDAAGNTGQASRTFVVDTTAPIVTIPVPPNQTNFGTHTPTFSFQVANTPATTPIVATQCSIDNGAMANCSTPFTTPALNDGAHTLTVRATDAAGNFGSASLPFTINTAPVLVSITVTPANSTVTVGGSRQFTATGTFSNGTNQDLTASCAWSSTNLVVARVSNVPGSKGLATGLSAGTAQIRATFSSVQGSTMLTVTAPVDPCTSGVVLDNFNRANGALGNNWAGLMNTSFYKIAGNRVDVQVGGPVFWNAASFGTNQSAFVTLSTVDTHSPSQGLLLKVQAGSCPQAGAIAVVYDAPARAFRVSTFRPPNLTWTPYPSAATTLVNGDKLGACVSASGVVTIYKNNVVAATVTLSAADKAFFNSRGGKIGLWTLLAGEAFFDDFGGGTVTQ